MKLNYVVRKKLQELTKQQVNREHDFRSLADVKDVVVLYHYYDSEKVSNGLQQLRSKGKNVRTCIYLPKKEEGEVGTNDLFVSAKKDLNVWGVPSEKVCERANALRADILIDLTFANCYALKYIALLHPAVFKVGLKWDEKDLYDLSVAVTDTNDIAYLFEQILFYLQTIRSK